MQRSIDICDSTTGTHAAGVVRLVERNPYLFLVGCPRSGTTLLQRMLDNHPQLAVANDTHFVPRALEQVEPDGIEKVLAGVDVPLTPALVESVCRYHRTGRLGLDETVVQQAAQQCDTYRRFISAMYTAFATQHGKPLSGEKTPDYVRRVRFLHALFPRAKMLHIVRDGRDVALSLLDWANEEKGPGKLMLWEDEPIGVSALWWRWLVKAGRKDGLPLGPENYHEVQYERLVAATEDEMRSVAQFLGLPFAAEMLAFSTGKTKFEPGRSAKRAWLPPTPGLRNWRTQMASSDVELFESLAGDLLSELGYEQSVDAVSAPVRARRDACLDWWKSEMARPWTGTVDHSNGHSRGPQPAGNLSGTTPRRVVTNRRAASTIVVDSFHVAEDIKMPFVARALDPVEVRKLFRKRLPRLAGGGRLESLSEIRVVRHRANRRCMIEYDWQPKQSGKSMTVVGKIHAKGLRRRWLRLQNTLCQAGFGKDSQDKIHLPEPIGEVPELQMWLQAKVPGTAATALLPQPGGVALARRIAEAIHKVHQVDIPTHRRHTMSDELAILHDRLGRMVQAKPQWAPRIDAVLRACDRLGAATPYPMLRGIHRDFYADHVIVDDEHLYLVDFDTYCLGDPGLDVGNFVGHLIEQSLRTLGRPDGLAPQQKALEDRFIELEGEAVQTSLETYTTLTLVRHIHLSTLFPKRRPLTEELLDLCEQRLGISS